jgi:uncharacterized protein (DUF1697 family)
METAAGANTSTYVALLRGINVGRANRVAMADLRAAFRRLGFTDVRTLLNSGNVVFAAPAAVRSEIAARIGDALADDLGLRAIVVVVSAAGIADVVAGNPLTVSDADASRMLVAFPAEDADLARLQQLLDQDWAPEALALAENAAYLWCPGGVAASRLVKALERVSGGAVTMRNWATVVSIRELLDRA